MRLSKKVCIITGGGSGIGQATSFLFAREGAVVVVADINITVAEETAAIIRKKGAEALALEVDVSQSDSVREMIDKVIAKFDRIDVLVNNAGYGIVGSVVETEEADWDRIMAVNLKGVYLGCKHVIPKMVLQGGGVIINTASIVASVGIKDRAAYCASKGGVAALTKAMALDHVADNIRVNSVAPGTIESPYFIKILANSEDAATLKRELEDRQAMRRLGKPEEIADAMLFLASSESSFVTGSMLTVDGGLTAQ